MTDPDEQPETDEAYAEEREKLSRVIEYINQTTARLEGIMPASAAYKEAAEGIQSILDMNEATLYSALDQPYFGRLDYLTSSLVAGDANLDDIGPDEIQEAPNCTYIGLAYIPENDVHSWTAPVAKLWYSTSHEDGYTAPRGYIATKVNLKRFLRIRDQQLIELKDIFRRALPVPDLNRQQILAEAVGGTSQADGHLQVIVDTIEPNQYERIANVSDKVLIIQGSAGSGKSEIGLHRIAYLLSPHNGIDESERPTPSTTLFVGPSKAFLEYAADVLPTLNVQENVQQITFGEWLGGQQSTRPRIRQGIWNNLLARGELTHFDEKAESFKGSNDMGDALLRHVKELAHRIRSECMSLPALKVRIPGMDSGDGVTVNKSEARKELVAVLPANIQDYQLNYRRQRFIDRIADLVWAKAGYARRVSGDEAVRLRRHINGQLVYVWCDSRWKHLDFRKEYASLLSDPENLVSMSMGSVPLEDAELIKNSSRNAMTEGFEDSDRGALAYLDHLLNGTINRRYRHIVVDEAQDLSPIEFRLLGISSTNKWFTILGDISQRLTPYRGVSKWRNLERVLGRSDISLQVARTSYRSNKHITLFNNRILRLFDRNIPAPIPFDREGNRPEYHVHSTSHGMYQTVIEDLERIRSLDGLKDAKIAILARDIANLNRFNQFCARQGFKDIALVGQEHHSNSRTVVARIPDTKGLEYDAVVVLGANEAFADTLFNQKLLYLATTRAKHYLGIHWYGRQSPILNSVYSGGIRTFDHRSTGRSAG